MIVVDASAVLEILKQTSTGLEFAAALDGHLLHAPHLIDLEVTRALHRWESGGEISPRAAQRALETFLLMPVTRYPHITFLPGIWALRHNLTAYDAAYLVLTKSLDAKLLTMDSALRGLAES
jgi:predicted nucleic acid-binding protein